MDAKTIVSIIAVALTFIGGLAVYFIRSGKDRQILKQLTADVMEGKRIQEQHRDKLETVEKGTGERLVAIETKLTGVEASIEEVKAQNNVQTTSINNLSVAVGILIDKIGIKEV